MSEPVHVLYCHCANARLVPDAVKRQVLERICASGAAAQTVADLCELAARRDPMLRELAGKAGLRVIACYPRAVRGLFAAAGVELGTDVRYFNLRVDNPAWVCAAALDGAEAVGEARSAAELEEQLRPAEKWQPWFPVIDRDRCTDCMQCLSFCLFGVYGRDAAGRLAVENPAACKTDCPACSRVCPEVAIIFPKYRQSPINGDQVSESDAQREPVKVDLAALTGGDVHAALRERSGARKRFSSERDEQRALAERERCLCQLQKDLDIPPELLARLGGISDGGKPAAPTPNPADDSPPKG